MPINPTIFWDGVNKFLNHLRRAPTSVYLAVAMAFNVMMWLDTQNTKQEARKDIKALNASKDEKIYQLYDKILDADQRAYRAKEGESQAIAELNINLKQTIEQLKTNNK